jgi:hypothetical protein
MRGILIAGVTAVLLSGASLGADDVMASFYGNTVVSTGGAAESRTHFKADHTFDAVFAGGAFVSKGTWELKDDQVCRIYDPPVPGMANPVCVAFGAHKVGDKWSVTVNGQERQVTLLQGIQ